MVSSKRAVIVLLVLSKELSKDSKLTNSRCYHNLPTVYREGVDALDDYPDLAFGISKGVSKTWERVLQLRGCTLNSFVTLLVSNWINDILIQLLAFKENVFEILGDFEHY